MPQIHFRFYHPSPQLRPYVRYYWALDSSEAFSALTFPIGCPQIIFHRKSPLFIPELSSYQSPFTVSGQVNFPSHLSSVGGLDMIVTVFHPHALRHFIATPVNEFYNREISGFDLSERSLGELAVKVSDCDDELRCVTMIDRWLSARLCARQYEKRSHINNLNFRRMDIAVRNILKSPCTPAAELAGMTCLSPKQFGRLFGDYVGMNPKEYSRIVRFQKSLWYMQNAASPINYAGLSEACGYADQSHLIREFKLFSGHTPKSLMTTAIPYSDLFTNPLT